MTTLFSVLRDRLNTALHKAMTFAEFMETVLYHPEFGYYSAGNVGIGKDGDFFTAASLGPDFGELLAEQFIELYTQLRSDTNQYKAFQLVEIGAGKGELAKDILTHLKLNYSDQLPHIDYIIVEKSPALIQQQQATLARLTKHANITWKNWEAIAPDSIQGCVFSNELIDAFPVHRVTVQDGQLKEIYVTLDQNSTTGLAEQIYELSNPALATYFENLGIAIADYPGGFQTEVNLQMLRWLETVAAKLKRGYLLTIDYGYPAQKYFHPQRKQGTLQAYWQHRHHSEYYANLGQQDLTAHVDFTTLQTYGETLGLQTLGLTQQGLFLMALGLGDRLDKLSQNPDVNTIFHRRDALHQLINPMGLGKFYVSLQGKNLTAVQRSAHLKGFAHPV